MKHRLVALDWMRGIVMVLMAVDHASAAFNAGRLITDSPAFYEPGMALPAAQFWTRWITHLCAPTFLFLAGTSLALSVERRALGEHSARAIDRHLFSRGLIIALLDPLLISWLWQPGEIILQVLYAIGVSLILMIPLRRLRTSRLLGLAAVLLVFGEAMIGLLFFITGNQPTAVGALLLHAGVFSRVFVGYPVLPWLAMMMLGWAFGRYLVRHREGEGSRWSPATVIGLGGLVALAIFLIVRFSNGYGNMTLLREDGSLIQWLHVSKYPPSLSFTALELGMMGVMLSVLFAFSSRLGSKVWAGNPLLVFGQTALFFYLLHIVLLELAARGLDLRMRTGLGATYLATAMVLIVLYPCCRMYRRYKAAHPGSWVRYL